MAAASERGDLLAEYVERAIELQEQGAPVSFADLCRDHPELTDTVRDALAGRDLVERWALSEANGAGPGGLVGRVLQERYCVGECIGIGAMGAVHRATDLQLERDVALKVMQAHRFGDDAEKRFLREAQVLATLRHRHVVTVYDRGITEDGLHYLVMELLDGMPMSRVLAELEQRLDGDSGWNDVHDGRWLDALGIADPVRPEDYVQTCARWAAELAAGLAAAHAAGITHRDVKPSNAFITRDGHARLIDFGIAARAADARLTRGETTLGTPQYMAPEQAAGTAAPNPQLDVYSLSATLYHLLAGRAPYRGSVAAVLTAIQRCDPPPLARLRRGSGLSPDLLAIVECGMARRPAQRYGTAAALQADLEAFLAGESIRARRIGPLTRACRTARRSTAGRALALIALVAVLVLAGTAWQRETERAHRAQHGTIYAQLPPTLTLGRAGALPAAEFAALAARLDRAVELQPDHVATRCLRAALRFDQGDLVGAADDHKALASILATDHTRALADRYRGAAAANDPAALQLDGLPEPGPADAFVAAFEALRARDWADAAALLPGESDDLAIREFRLLALLGLGATQGDAELVASLRDPALELGGAYGEPTTRTLYVLERALLQMRAYAEAIPPLEQLSRSAPRDYNVALDLAIACRQTWDLAAAERAARRAVALRTPPLNDKALSTLAKILADGGHHDAALAEVAAMPADGRNAWRRHETWAFVEFERCLDLLARGREAEARAAADQAIDQYQHAADLGHRSAAMKMNVAACTAVVDNNDERFCQALLDLLQNDPDNAHHLANVARRLPVKISSELATALRAYFHAAAERPPRH